MGADVDQRNHFQRTVIIIPTNRLTAPAKKDGITTFIANMKETMTGWV